MKDTIECTFVLLLRSLSHLSLLHSSGEDRKRKKGEAYIQLVSPK
jgi:hypothetical protein